MSSIPVIEQITIQKHTILDQQPIENGAFRVQTMSTSEYLNISANLRTKSKIKKIKKMK
jgi:hypothetical protein